MVLSIDNFAKINGADIMIDGITVIAGANNTGKSTVGKILFSLFNAMNDIDTKIFEERRREIREVCRMSLNNYPVTNEIRATMFRRSELLSRRIADRVSYLALDEITKENIYEIVFSVFDDFFAKETKKLCDFENIVDEIVDAIVEIFNIPETTIFNEVLSRYFRNVFSGQINSLYQKDIDAKLILSIKGKEMELLFRDNDCVKYHSQIAIMHKAIYIDNPFVLDSLSRFADLNMMDRVLRDMLTSDSEWDVMNGIIESVMVKEKLEEIDTILGKVVDGNILKEKSENYYLENEEFQEPISFNNLSTGLKSFVLIKMLLEKGIIKNKDVLILDEPEIHLHPEWQIAYAELIVLIQKHFDLSIVLATHSPYFVDAIDLFSAKYETKSKVNYYLSSEVENGVMMELVTSDIEKIYQKMASPIQVLESLRHELNNR